MAEITSQEQFEKVRDRLKAGEFSDRPELQMELAQAAQAWKSQSPEVRPEFTSGRFSGIAPDAPTQGSIADPLGQGLTFGFGDELAGLAGATIGTFDPNLEGTSFGERFRGIRDVARENAQAFAQRNPNTALAAELAGGIATGGVGAARAGAFQAAKSAPTLAGRLSPIVQTGAVQGGLFGAGKSEAEDLRGTAQDALKGAAIGATTAPILPALAGGARGAAQRVFQTQSDNPVFQRATKLLADKAGITNLTTGQRTGSRAIRGTETTAAETIFGGRLNRQLEQNRRKLQASLMRMSGFPSANDDVARGLISRESLDAAQNEFSKKYNKLLGGRSVSLDTEDFVDALADVQTRHGKLLPFQQKKQIAQIADQVFDDVTDGPVNAARYNGVRSSLAKLERNNKANNPTLSDFYRDLKHAVDDEVANQLGFGTAKKSLDLQYSRFTTLRDTFDSLGGIDASRGDLPLSSLLRNAQGAKKGTDRKFQDLVRAGQIVLGDPVPNSATASRLANLAFLGEGASTATGLIDPTAGAITFGAPIFGTQALSRGFTGSPTADKLIQSGLLTAPVTAPLLGNFEQSP